MKLHLFTFLRRVRILPKLLISTGFAAFLLILNVFYIYQTSSENYSQLNFIEKIVFPVSEKSNENNFLMERLTETLSGAVAASEESMLFESEALYQKMNKNLLTIIEIDPLKSKKVNHIKVLLDDYYLSATSFAKQIISHKVVDIHEKTKELQNKFFSLKNEIKVFDKNNAEELNYKLVKTKNFIAQILNLTMVIALMTLFFNIATSFIISKSVVNDINLVIEAIGKLSKENKNNKNRIFIQSNDEIGWLVNTFNDFSGRIEKDYMELANAKEEIVESIKYAAIIQKAYLNITHKELNEWLKQYSILWNPRDNVGGDFYFFRHIKSKGSLLAIFDCTGHGVPGAFMTIIAYSIIDKVVKNENIHNPAQLLCDVNHNIKCALNQIEDHSKYSYDPLSSDEGMDAAFIFIPESYDKITYSGANIPLFILSPHHAEVELIKTSSMGVGYKDTPLEYQWKNVDIPIEKNMLLWVTSDGLIEQVGGSKKLQYGIERFKKSLLTHRNQTSVNDINNALLDDLNEYRGSQIQRDDITLFGIQF
jgi:serine phosphatase RsbU (regulator of sigma subunit)